MHIQPEIRRSWLEGLQLKWKVGGMLTSMFPESHPSLVSLKKKMIR
jgi:hypothetical protein